MIASNEPSRASDRPPLPVCFLADAHLGAEPPEAEATKERDLLAFLNHLHGRASCLYLVGDVFDFWFEYATVVPGRYVEVLAALAELARSGTEIHFLGGNHDYWAGPRLEELTGASVHHGPISRTHFGRRIFIAHGDGLPAGDAGYRVLKGVIRSRPAVAAFRLLHPTIAASIARWASSLSTITEERIERAIPPMTEFLERTLDAGYDAAVVGHVHRPLLVTRGGRSAVIVGDWMANRSVVVLDADGFHLKQWSGDALAPAADGAD